ncbi:MAG: sulfotransferase [Panacagrimonas sp.]
MTLLTAEQLMLEAVNRAGLDNFGADNFRDGLDKLVEGVNESGLLIPGREENIKRDLVRLLVNRLRWQKDLSDHPEIAEVQFLPPVAIVSLPRAGTTKLQRMLSATKAFQDLPYWQILMPARIREHADDGVEARIAETEAFCDWRVSVQPDIQKTHRISAQEAEEDIFLQEIGFRSRGLGFIHQSQTYTEWLAQQDVGLSYDILRNLLQYLQWQFHSDQPKPWLLKSPVNLGMEDQLQRIFPMGLKLICPHREPAEIFPSMCRLIETFSGLYYRSAIPREALGEVIVEQMALAMDQHLVWREAHREVEVLDIGFGEICANSMSTLERVCAFIGMPLEGHHRAEVARWDRENPRFKDGVIAETLATYGLTADRINARFAKYRKRFQQYL